MIALSVNASNLSNSNPNLNIIKEFVLALWQFHMGVLLHCSILHTISTKVTFRKSVVLYSSIIIVTHYTTPTTNKHMEKTKMTLRYHASLGASYYNNTLVSHYNILYTLRAAGCFLFSLRITTTNPWSCKGF